MSVSHINAVFISIYPIYNKSHRTTSNLSSRYFVEETEAERPQDGSRKILANADILLLHNHIVS